MAAWFREIEHAGLTPGGSLDLDFHSVPANTQQEPLEKHYISRRSRSQQGILTFLARDASLRALCYARAGITKAEQPAEIIRFVDFWQQHTGSPPAELVFDSRLTTYAYLHQLNQRHIQFPHPCGGAPGPCSASLWSRPASAWRRITLPSLTRRFALPRYSRNVSPFAATRNRVRQIKGSSTSATRSRPVLLTNNLRSSCPALVTRYAQRIADC